MTTCPATLSMTPTSSAWMGFTVPVTSAASPLGAAALPNAPKSTFVTGRFMALHMKSVSSVPDEPTSVPAMIMATLAIANPSAATASPVKLFSSEMTTGISAPPMGSTIMTPNASASTQQTRKTHGL